MKARRVVSWVGPLLLLCIACGGASEVVQATGEVMDDDDTSNDEGDTEKDNAKASRAIPGVVLMDDGADGDSTLLHSGEDGFVGYWYTYDDRQECDNPDFAEGNAVVCGSKVCAASGQTLPVPYYEDGLGFAMAEYATADAAAAPLEGEQTRNAYGIRLQGGGNKSWGAGVGVGLKVRGAISMAPYDLTAQEFTALRFLARTATPGMQLKVKIKDAYSDPNGAKCFSRLNDCADIADVADIAALTCTCSFSTTQGCHDDPSVILGQRLDFPMVTSEWTLYEIPLDDFVRGNWGIYVPGEAPSSVLDATRAYQLQFEVMRPSTEEALPPFDLWIDNVGFVTE